MDPTPSPAQRCRKTIVYSLRTTNKVLINIKERDEIKKERKEKGEGVESRRVLTHLFLFTEPLLIQTNVREVLRQSGGEVPAIIG